MAEWTKDEIGAALMTGLETRLPDDAPMAPATHAKPRRATSPASP